MEQKNELYDWLKSHPFINLNGVCRQVGYDRANLIKSMELGKPLKEEIMEKFEISLKPYGYKAGITEKVKIQDLTTPTNLIEPEKPMGSQKTNFTINTKPPKLEGESALDYRIRCEEIKSKQ